MQIHSYTFYTAATKVIPTYPLHSGGYSNNFLYSPAESFDIVSPVEHVPDVDVLGDTGVLEPAPQVVPLDGGGRLEDGERDGALSYRGTFGLL